MAGRGTHRFRLSHLRCSSPLLAPKITPRARAGQVASKGAATLGANEAAVSPAFLQNYIWDFSLSSSMRAGRTASIQVEAWSEENGSTSSQLKFYLSKDRTLNVRKDKLIGQLQIDLTGPTYGDTNSLFYGTVRIPANTTPGNYFFFLTIDGRERTITGSYFSQRLNVKKR